LMIVLTLFYFLLKIRINHPTQYSILQIQCVQVTIWTASSMCHLVKFLLSWKWRSQNLQSPQNSRTESVPFDSILVSESLRRVMPTPSTPCLLYLWLLTIEERAPHHVHNHWHLI
jgi:hypothetical protein